MIYFPETNEDLQAIYDCAPAVSLVYFNAATFGSVRWVDCAAAVCHELEEGLIITAPPMPAHKTCVFDVLAKFRNVELPVVPGFELLPCGVYAGVAARWLPNPVDRDAFRLNYYLGVTLPAALYVHPEHDRPLTEQEEAAIAGSHAAALTRAHAWLSACARERGQAGEYDVRTYVPAGIFNYPNRIKTNRLIAGGRIVKQ